jgi:hypothetical protein
MVWLQPKLRVSTTIGGEVQTSISSRIPERFIIRWYDGVKGPDTHGFQIESAENGTKFEVQLKNVKNNRSSGRNFVIRIKLSSRDGFTFEKEYTVNKTTLSPDYMRCAISELTEYGVKILRNGISNYQIVEADLKTITDKFDYEDETTKRTAAIIGKTREASAVCCTSFFCCPMISDYIRNRGHF